MDRILLVEDDRNTLEGLAEILSMENYEVVKAIDGKSAVRELKNSSFNVLLTDLVLPDFDGLELANLAWKEQNEIMVIILTAFGSVKHAVNAMKKGVFDYLTKPIDIDELLIVLKKAINQQKLRYDLPFYIKANHGNIRLPDFSELKGMNYRNQLEYADKIIIKKALEETKGNKTHAAKRLGFSIRMMRNKVNKYDL